MTRILYGRAVAKIVWTAPPIRGTATYLSAIAAGCEVFPRKTSYFIRFRLLWEATHHNENFILLVSLVMAVEGP